jgi:chromosome condensin MukBEF MukE localization factor
VEEFTIEQQSRVIKARSMNRELDTAKLAERLRECRLRFRRCMLLTNCGSSV